MNLKKTFLKTYKGNVLASYGKNVSVRRVFLSIELVPDDEGFRSVAIRVSLDVKKDFLRQKLKLFCFSQNDSNDHCKFPLKSSLSEMSESLTKVEAI